MKTRTTLRASLLAALLLAACSKKHGETTTPPTPPDDVCDSAQTASATASCSLAPGQTREGHIAPVGNIDWWMLELAAPLPERALLTVSAQYRVPATPVILSVNVLKADGISSIGSASDPRPRGSPGVAQVVARLPADGAGRYFVVVRHDTSQEDPVQDKDHPYYLTAALSSDPDTNEPNDATPTAIALPACGRAQASGALSTRGDVDVFSFEVQPCTGKRTLLHLALDAPTPSAQGIRLDYALAGPAGPVTSDHAASPFAAQSLVTARVVQAGTYTLTVRAYRAPTDREDPPGDPTFTYGATIDLYPDADDDEGGAGNDTPETASDVALTQQGPSRTLTGRLSYVGDLDYYAVRAPSKAARLHYKLTFSNAPGRFDPVPTLQVRELQAFSQAASANDCRATCPNGSTETLAWCNRSQCLWQRRVEAAELGSRNFEGQLQVPAGQKTFVLVGYIGGAGADDREYTLELTLLDDTQDEAAAPHTRDSAMVVNLPAEGTTVLGHGSGLPSSDVPANGLAAIPHGPLDYDAVQDVDFFEMHFTPLPRPPPPEPPDGGTDDASVDASVDAGPDTVDHALTLAWVIPPATGQRAGDRSHDIGMRLHFCKDKACTKVVSTRGFLGYKSAPVKVWYPETGLGLDGGLGLQQHYAFDASAGTFNVQPVICMCIEAQYAESGRFWVEMQAQNRASYEDAKVGLQMTVGPYPPTVTDGQGRSFQCPTPCQWVTKSL